MDLARSGVQKMSKSEAAAPLHWLRRQCPACGLWINGIVTDGQAVAPHGCNGPKVARVCGEIRPPAIVLSPGWLKRDIGRAIARLKEWHGPDVMKDLKQ